ncbi:Methyltransferase type 11 [Ktedonobacter racemifer DSM 44963]|uniref:Methyltransferase type 11 n=2 Tax=Ktedonobacter racemifer TaxID=363277 RepID=D6U5G0_KTERA|nr:Methyltransferase type 11 [Ktedonobacter racemifer DSM 44963]
MLQYSKKANIQRKQDAHMSFFKIFSRKTLSQVQTDRRGKAPSMAQRQSGSQPIGEHGNAPYLLPRNDEEINRLDFQHYILRATLKGNALAPLQHPTSILDVGCGTGRWCQEMAVTYPQATVVGFDLVSPLALLRSPQFPDTCRFVQGNVLEGLPFAPQSFDYVHQRLLVFALPTQRWPGEIQELVKVTRPGGWVEIVEVDITFEQMGPASTQLATWITEASRQKGIDPSMARRAQTLLKVAGLTNIVYQQVPNPVGSWGGRIGTMAATGVQAINKAMRQQVLSQLGVSPVQYDQALATSLEEYDSYKSYSNTFIACGQRPL